MIGALQTDLTLELMPKKKGEKIKLVPERPQDVIKKLKKNGLKLVNKKGGDWYYMRVKNGKRYLAPVSVHPGRKLGKPFIKLVIRKSGKTNQEWVNL